jgi:hypothetical protein
MLPQCMSVARDASGLRSEQIDFAIRVLLLTNCSIRYETSHHFHNIDFICIQSLTIPSAKLCTRSYNFSLL